MFRSMAKGVGGDREGGRGKRRETAGDGAVYIAMVWGVKTRTVSCYSAERKNKTRTISSVLADAG